MVRRQYDLLKSLEHDNPGISTVVRDAEGYILLDEEPDSLRAGVDLRLAAS
jgi:hypothetical protein